MLVNTSSNEISDAAPASKVTTVSSSILNQFFDELAKDKSLSDVASKLRKIVLDDGVFAEPAIRAALVPDAL